MNTGKERRRSTRKDRVLNIQFRLKESQGIEKRGHWCLGVTQDMSAHGLSFLTEQTLAPSDIIELQVIFSGVLDIVKAAGRVVRVEERVPDQQYLVGIDFNQIL